jgi:thiol-disulfide isomerase/thioredoxin
MKIIAAVTAFFLMGICVFAAEQDAATTPRKAPDFTFSLPGKGPQQLSQYRGKVVALGFIFTTCPHCQAASKVMTKFQEEYGSRGLQVIDVAVNANADLLVENFVKDFKVGFPVGWVSPEQMTTFMGFDPKARFVVPQLALIDRKGVIHYQTPAQETETWDKLMKEDAIRAHIEELLNMGGSTTSSTAHPKSLSKLDVPAR